MKHHDTPKELDLISVIVPVFNVEDYVEDCVRDLMGQTYPHLEIVLVDDGSTDSSGSICDRLAAEDDRIVVIHKQNGGLSEARNCGLERATGDIISFVDSDDRVSDIFIEVLYIAMLASDCFISGVPGGDFFSDGVVEFEHDVSKATECVSVMSDRSYIESMLYQAYTTGTQWRMYRREVLGDNPFPVGLYFEDLASTYVFIMRAKQIALVDCRKLYAYRLRSSGIIEQSYRPVKKMSAIKVSRQLYADIEAAYPDLCQAAASRCFSLNRLVFSQIPSSEIEDRSAIWKQLRIYAKTVAHDPKARKRERVAAAIALFGQEPFSAFCSLARRLGKMR